MKTTLYGYLGQLFHGFDGEITYSDWDKYFKDWYRYYITTNPDSCRVTGKCGQLLTAKASSKFDDGFCGDIFAVKVDEFYIAQMNLRDTSDVRWHLKMIKNGWEVIPKKLYDRIVEV